MVLFLKIFSLMELAGASYESSKQLETTAKDNLTSQTGKKVKPEKAKTVSQADEELRQKLEQMSGGGGASGIEYEDGKPSAMKRSVRNNMFRYIWTTTEKSATSWAAADCSS